MLKAFVNRPTKLPDSLTANCRPHGTRFELCEQTSRWTGQVVVVLEPYSEKIGEKIEIDVLPHCQTSFQGRDQQRSGDLPGSNGARILRNNCVIDQEPQSHDAYTVCQAHFPQSLATIREDKQIARAIDDQQKLRPDGKMSYVPLINASNYFFDQDLQSKDDSRFVHRIPREHAIFQIQYRNAKGHEEFSTATCTIRVMMGPPTKCDVSANESPGCGQKGPQRMCTYEHHQIVEDEHKGLARQALKLVKEMQTLDFQECLLDKDLQVLLDDLCPVLKDAEVIEIGLKTGYDLLYKAKQRPHLGRMMGAHLADEWMHDENFPLLYFEKGCGRYQRQKYVGWTKNSWKLLETVSPQELTSAVRTLQIECGNSVRLVIPFRRSCRLMIASFT